MSNKINGEKPEFGNPRHIQHVRNEEKDAELCLRCGEKQEIIKQLKEKVASLEYQMKTFFRR